MSKSIATMTIEGKPYSVRATYHALDRMKKRKVDEYVVSGTILALGKNRLLDLQENDEDAIIIDNDKGISIVISFYNNTIKVVTVIDKSRVWVKSNTTIVNI